jgi:hypothetical protein
MLESRENFYESETTELGEIVLNKETRIRNLQGELSVLRKEKGELEQQARASEKAAGNTQAKHVYLLKDDETEPIEEVFYARVIPVLQQKDKEIGLLKEELRESRVLITHLQEELEQNRRIDGSPSMWRVHSTPTTPTGNDGVIATPLALKVAEHASMHHGTVAGPEPTANNTDKETIQFAVPILEAIDGPSSPLTTSEPQPAADESSVPKRPRTLVHAGNIRDNIGLNTEPGIISSNPDTPRIQPDSLAGADEIATRLDTPYYVCCTCNFQRNYSNYDGRN